jgi:factor associated with neutral sphingomyelinase activation
LYELFIGTKESMMMTMSTWFGSSPSNVYHHYSGRSDKRQQDNMNGVSGKKRNVKELIHVLYPKKSSAASGIGGIPGSGGGGVGGGSINRGGLKSSHSVSTRFSQLLLEHGEKAIQDWAVVAHSTPYQATTSSTTSNDYNSREQITVNRHDVDQPQKQEQQKYPSHTPKSKKITWFQSPEYNAKNNHNTLSSTPTSTMRRSREQSKQQQSSANNSFMDSNMHYPSTTHMKNIEGRLYLCTNSIVFEPNDQSRGIIRCPFSKMDNGPPYSSSSTTTNNNSTTPSKNIGVTTPVNSRNSYETIGESIRLSCRRHMVMKEDNTIGPYRQVSIPCQFRFVFLHSSPTNFLEMSLNLYHHFFSNPSNRHSKMTNRVSDKVITKKWQQQQHQIEYFDVSNFVDIREQIQTTNSIQCSILTPLQSQPGTLVVTNERIYFQKQQSYTTIHGLVQKWNLCAIVAMARRYNGLRDSAIEIYFLDECNTSNSNSRNRSYSSILFGFERRHDRELVLRCIQQTFGGGIDYNNSTSYWSNNNNNNCKIPCLTDREFVIQVVQEWMKGNITNFDYLLALNCASGRTFHDLSRYPVFPWVIQDYRSSKLDLTKDSTFRDLSKPVGALNDERLEYFRKRLRSMEDMDEAFLYGTHYSAPGYVLYFLVRTMPEHMLCLQNGKFDSPDRLFYSVGNCYNSALSNHADVKELIPEFYSPSYDSDFLINARGLQLGATQNGDRVDDVKLPPWAKSPRDYIKQNIAALESEICTNNLPKWIDLIFGYKSRGQNALDSDNLFHQYAYLGPNDLASMQSESDRNTAELQATEFGIVPDLLFVNEHPRRDSSTGDTSENQFDDLVSPEVGRALSTKDDPMSGREAWELLEAPGTASGEHDYNNEGNNVGNANVSQSDPHQNNVNLRALSIDDLSYDMQPEPDLRKATSLECQSDLPGIDTVDSVKLQNFAETSPCSSSWDIQILERKRIHNDAISGCILMFDDHEAKLSVLATTSLDGGLKVQAINLDVPSSGEEKNSSGGGFSSLTRFSYSTIMSRGAVGSTNAPIPESKLSDYRTHSARDPLACLVLTGDGSGGTVAFAGGHDDVVLAYGIKSACAVASVYSHRDAVTGLDLIQRTPFDADSSVWLENSTHVMVSGSWDATVKVWSVSVSSGETVSINREPLAELFDAESSIVCVSAISSMSFGDDNGVGIIIAAGCADGSFCVWNLHSDGVQVLIHKEPTRKGSGPCSNVKWISEGGNLHLFAAFSTGKIASYTLLEESFRRESAVSVGSAGLSLAYMKGSLLVGCADGGLRLLTILEGAVIDSTTRPVLWTAVNNAVTSPGISSICFTNKEERIDLSVPDASRCICCSGAEDGSIVLFELKKA